MRSPVTAVTKWEFCSKKDLLSPKTSSYLDYHLDPFQGPAGNRLREVIPLPNPGARLLILVQLLALRTGA